MDETTGAIPGYAHTHGVYGNYGNYGDYGRGRNDDGVLVDIINKNDLNSSIREVGRAVDIGNTASAAGFANVAKGQSDGVVATSGLITDLGRDVNNGVHNTLVQNLNAFNSVERAIERGTVATATQGAAILAKLCECCSEMKTEMLKGFCDTKELVRAENGQTRDLITANQILDLQRQLNDVKATNSNLQQTNEIVAALSKAK